MSSVLNIERQEAAPTLTDSRVGTAAKSVARWRLLAWMAIALLLYYPSFFSRPVFDDLSHVEFAAREGWQLWHIGPIFFRPLERVLIGLNWMLDRDNFWIVRSFGLSLFVLNVALVYDLAGRIVSQKSPWVPFIIATIFLVHPMHVLAVAKIDTFSEQMASLFALLSVRCAMNAAATRDTNLSRRTGLYWAGWAVLTVFLGMLSKEAFAGIAAATPLFFAAALGISTREARRTLMWLVAGECLAGIAYLAVRVAFGFPLLGARVDAARYHLHIGFNVLKNVAAELASIAFPGSTLTLFVRFDTLAVMLALTVLVTLLVLLQHRFRDLFVRGREVAPPQRRATLIVLIAAVAAFFPTCLIPELISENQTALALPFMTLLVLAAPLSLPTPLSHERLSWQIAFACASVALFSCMALATSGKVLAMRQTSDRAYRMGDLILAKYYEHPSAVVTVCFDPTMRSTPAKYSVLSMPDDLAAFFQLSRLRIEQPGITINVQDLRQAGTADPARCNMHLSGMTVTP